jgi:Haem-binding domain
MAAGSVTVHPFGAPKQFDAGKPLAGSLNLPADIAVILKRSCADCHSSQTVWPWYSYVAPMSWLVERDVDRGRRSLNLSEWQRYTFKQHEKLLADIASAVKNGEMPLPQYTLIHRQARLSDAERDIIYRWARSERRKLRAAESVPAELSQSISILTGSQETMRRSK